MKRLWLRCAMIVLVFFYAKNFKADSVEFRTVVARNDQVVGGEFHLDLEMRITSGVSPRTLNSLTVEVIYGSELTEWSTTFPGTAWAFGSGDGYTRVVDKLSSRYKTTVTGGGVGQEGAGVPPGWDVTTTFQKVVTLRWTINTLTSVNISIDDNTDAAAYFENFHNDPQGDTINWLVTNQDLGNIPLQKPTSIQSPTLKFPSKFHLYPNYPNPFNPTTTLRFDIPLTGTAQVDTELIIYNSLGQTVKSLVQDRLSAGSYKVQWDGTTDSGYNAPGGIYFAKFKTDGFLQTRKLVLLK